MKPDHNSELIKAINHLTVQVKYNNVIFTEIREMMDTHDVLYMPESESQLVH